MRIFVNLILFHCERTVNVLHSFVPNRHCLKFPTVCMTIFLIVFDGFWAFDLESQRNGYQTDGSVHVKHDHGSEKLAKSRLIGSVNIVRMLIWKFVFIINYSDAHKINNLKKWKIFGSIYHFLRAKALLNWSQDRLAIFYLSLHGPSCLQRQLSLSSKYALKLRSFWMKFVLI